MTSDDPVIVDGRCVCCDLPPASCGKVLEQQRRAEYAARRAAALRLPGVVVAKIPGNCPSCHERFAANEPIVHTPAGWAPVLCCTPLGA